MEKLDAVSERILQVMNEDTTIFINKDNKEFFLFKGETKLSRVCSKKLQKLVKLGKVSKSNVGDIHVLTN